MTIWKQIDGFSNYEISDCGEIRNIKTGNYLSQYLNKYGYKQIKLYNGGKSYARQVHRLIAQAFIPNPDNLPEVDHINCIKSDNRLENLRWVTHKDNMHNYDRTPVLHTNGKQKTAIRMLDTNNNIIKQFDSIADAYRYLGKDPTHTSTISIVLAGKRKTYMGYKWEVVE